MCALNLYHVIFSICLLIFSIHEHLSISYSHLKEACMVVEIVLTNTTCIDDFSSNSYILLIQTNVPWIINQLAHLLGRFSLIY